MEYYFDIGYAGPPFELFGAAHLSMVVVFAIIATVFIRQGKAAGPETRTRMRQVFGIIMLLNEAGTHIWKVNYGIWAVEESLPFQLCGAMAWITGLTLVLGWRKTYPMVYFFGLGGALQGVLTPDAGTYGFPHYQMVETVFAHSALVVAGLWVVLVEGYRPTLRHLGFILLGLNVAALVMYFINVGLGSNYLFVNGKPPNASVIDLMPAWPLYIPVLEVIVLTVFSLLYLPFVRLRKKETTVEVSAN